MPRSSRRSKQSPREANGKHAEHVEHAEQLEEQSTPPTPVIYEVVRRYGEEEMSRPTTSLWWSGLAGGLSISFSLLAEAILRMYLPDASWRPLLVALGYPVGFLMVVLSRQQLFTETTITVVLPLMKDPSPANLGRTGRMWLVVLGANLAGTLAAAIFCSCSPAVDEALRTSMLEVSRHAMDHGWLEMGFRGITAGFLMAAMVWLLPGAGQSQFPAVAVITYVIGVADSSHIVAGSVEAFMLVISGDMGYLQFLGAFFLPTLTGNIVGGTALFAVLYYAQVMKEI